MNLEACILANHDSLCPDSSRLIDRMINHFESSPIKIDLDGPGVYTSMRRAHNEDPKNVSPWPIIISVSKRQEFEFLVQKIPALIQKCIIFYFSDNKALFKEFLDLDPVMYDMFVELHPQFNKEFIRMDIIYSNGDPKIIEVNAGSALGGYQLSSLENQFAKVIDHVTDSSRQRLVHRNPLKLFFETIYTCIFDHQGVVENVNLLALTGDDISPQEISELRNEFVLLKPASVNVARFVALPHLKKITVNDNGSLVVEGTKIDAVINIAGGTCDVIGLTRLHLARKIFYADNPFQLLIGSKLHFAIMHELVSMKKLNSLEEAFVTKYIPWSIHTFNKKNEIVTWKGSRIRLIDLMSGNKENFVIKKINESQGNSIYVGKFTEQSDWLKVITTAFEEPQWIAQEYLDPDFLYSPINGTNSIYKFKSIWGVFGFLGQYSGSWVRLNRESYGNGVINTARGAISGFVYEIDKQL